MPQDAPGKLTGDETANVLAYMLQTGEFPSGRAELRADEAALNQIGWPAGATATKTQPANPALPFPPAGNLAR